MRNCLPVLLACFACVAAWAQEVVPAQTDVPAPTSREQRRAELRTVLQAHSQILSSDPGSTAVPPVRHLSVQERAEMRRQLRRQQVAPQRSGN